MLVRYKSSGKHRYASQFNLSALSEVLTGDDSAYVHELDVYLNDGTWKDLRAAFRDRDVITDNYNTCFFEPPTEEDQARGYTL